jgi:hypothetical protein
MKKRLLVLFTLSYLFNFYISAQTQPFVLTVGTPTQCFSSGNNSSTVSVSFTNSTVTNYTWAVVSSSTCVGTASFTGNGQTATLYFPCCGVYNIYCSAINNTITPGTPVTITSTFVTATVSCLPNLSIGGGSSLCQSGSSTLTASGASTYTWYPSNSTSSSIVVSPTTSTCYTLVGKTSIGCSNTAVQCLTVGTSPTVTVIGGGTVCPGTPVSFTASGASSYIWFVGTQTATGAVLSLTPTATTCFSVKGTSSSGCFTYTGSCITLGNNSLSISSPSSVCLGNSATLTASGATSYTWLPGNITSSVIVVTPTANTCFTVLTNSTFSCGSTIYRCLYVTNPPSISISGGGNCSGSSATLTAGGASSFTWSPGNFTSTSIVVTPTANTCYTVLGVTSIGCSNTAVQCLSVGVTPTVTVIGGGTICAGTPVSFTASGANTYLWFVGTQTASGAVLTLTPTAATCFSVKGTSSSGCYTYTGSCVSVANSSLSVSGPSYVCTGNSTTLTANGATSYTWLPGNITGSIIVVTPTANTCYTILTNSTFSCGSTIYKCINVTSQPVISVSGGGYCAGQTKTLTASGASSFTWAPFNLTGNSIVITPTANTCYTVLGMTSIGCTGFASNCVSLTTAPNLSITGGTTASCPGTTVGLYAYGASTYTWFPNLVANPYLQITPTANNCYTIVGAANGCTASAVRCLTLLPQPIIAISGNTAICAGNSTTLYAQGASSYTWSPSNTTFSLLVYPVVNTCYTVAGMGSNNCIGYAYRCVTLMTNSISLTASTNSVCLGSSANFTASGSQTYTWSTGASGTTITILPSSNTVISVGGFNSAGCFGMTSTTLTVDTNCTMVYPGDANSDGNVTLTDVLELGLAYLNTGSARPVTGNTYIAHYATNWSGTVSTGKNKVNADCNGDGVVNMSDTTAVSLNYLQTHSFKPSPSPAGAYGIKLNPEQGNFAAGAWNKLDVVLEPGMSPSMIPAAGFSFRFNFDNSQLEQDSVYLVYTPSFLNSNSTNIEFKKSFFALGALHAASVRTDATDVTGTGKIAEIYFKTKQNLSFGTILNFSLDDVHTANQQKSIQSLPNAQSVLNLTQSPTGINTSILTQSKSTLFPNPSNNSFTIRSAPGQTINYCLRDVTGRLILKGAYTSELKLNTASIENGVYLIELSSNVDTEFHNLIIAH